MAPSELKLRPISVKEARLAGVSWKDLQKKTWKRLRHGQYAWSGLPADTKIMLQAVVERMPAGYAFSGPTAAWLLGLDFAPCEPIEVTVDRDIPVRARAGVRLRRAALRETDVITCHGFRTTSAFRTFCDLGSRRDLVESVVSLDMALHAGLVELSQLKTHIETHTGGKSIGMLRRSVGLADPRAESPMETRLRVELVRGRLPRPSVQAELQDAGGNFIGRADLYYPDRRLVIEYDGENHKDRLIADLRRQNALVNAGYHLLRFTVADLRLPGSVVAQVRHARARLARVQP